MRCREHGCLSRLEVGSVRSVLVHAGGERTRTDFQAVPREGVESGFVPHAWRVK